MRDNAGDRDGSAGRARCRSAVAACYALDLLWHRECSDHEGLLIPVGTLFEVILGGLDAGLGTGLILIAGGAADADRADLHLVRGHDW